MRFKPEGLKTFVKSALGRKELHIALQCSLISSFAEKLRQKSRFRTSGSIPDSVTINKTKGGLFSPPFVLLVLLKPEWLKTFFKVFLTPTLLACLSATGVFPSACSLWFKPAPCRFDNSVYHTNRKTTLKRWFFYWCARPESNRHGIAPNRF